MTQPVVRDLRYSTTIKDETIGELVFKVHCLVSLEKTIDEVFDQLAAWGEQELLDQYCPYFGVLWPSGRTLAEWVARKGLEFLAGKRVLEIGCGLALPSLVAARLGAAVTASDLHSEVPKFLKKNIELNALSGVSFIPIDWRSHGLAKGAFDLVIGSDLVYEKHCPETLATFLNEIADANTEIVITDPGRFYLRNFQDAMAEKGFVLQRDSLMGGAPDVHGDRVFLMVYKRARTVAS